MSQGKCRDKLDDLKPQIRAVVDKMMPVLAGHPPEVQAVALAECISIWLAGHTVLDNLDATRQLREDLLFALITTIRELVEAR
jgi:hypothetical protein